MKTPTIFLILYFGAICDTVGNNNDLPTRGSWVYRPPAGSWLLMLESQKIKSHTGPFDLIIINSRLLVRKYWNYRGLLTIFVASNPPQFQNRHTQLLADLVLCFLQKTTVEERNFGDMRNTRAENHYHTFLIVMLPPSGHQWIFSLQLTLSCLLVTSHINKTSGSKSFSTTFHKSNVFLQIAADTISN